VDNVIFARPGKGERNKAYRPTQSDSPGGRTGAKSNVYDSFAFVLFRFNYSEFSEGVISGFGGIGAA